MYSTSENEDLVIPSDRPKAESVDLWLTLMDGRKLPLLAPYRLNKLTSITYLLINVKLYTLFYKNE